MDGADLDTKGITRVQATGPVDKATGRALTGNDAARRGSRSAFYATEEALLAR